MTGGLTDGDFLASILKNRTYEPAPLPARIPIRLRVTRATRLLARQLSPTGWLLVFAAILVGSALGAIL